MRLLVFVKETMDKAPFLLVVKKERDSLPFSLESGDGCRSKSDH